MDEQAVKPAGCLAARRLFLLPVPGKSSSAASRHCTAGLTPRGLLWVEVRHAGAGARLRPDQHELIGRHYVERGGV